MLVTISSVNVFAQNTNDGTTANNMIKVAEKQSQAFSQWLSNARRGITD